MRFGVFYQLQVPKPWTGNAELNVVQEALDQIQLADELGLDYAWATEHHFLEEYSHSAAPEVFLAAAAARTKNIRLAHGIRQVIANYNHPARSAEGIAMLDLISRGRLEWGIGEGSTRQELGGFGIPAKFKRAMCLEAAEQIANMLVMEPYPGFEGQSFKFPCRNVVPKPLQKPHPPMWMACTNRETIKTAAALGMGALAFSFLNAEEAQTWASAYYDVIKSDACVPIGHAINANIAMVSGFTLHSDREEALRRGRENFEYFAFALSAMVVEDFVPGRTQLWEDYQRRRHNAHDPLILAAAEQNKRRTAGIGTPEDMRKHLRGLQASGVDQVIFMAQAGRSVHEETCESLRIFADEVMPEFVRDRARRDAEKEAELRPYLDAAMARKKYLPALPDHEIPVVKAAVARAQVGR